MCGRVVVAIDSSTLLEIARANNMRNSMRLTQSYNVSPGRFIPGVYRSKNNIDEREGNSLEMMKWGSKNSNDYPISNARVENVSLFYKNWKRCVIIIDGYYEWKKITSESDIEKVLNIQPYYIHNKNQNYLLLAGVFKDSLDEDGFEQKEVLIITKNSNKYLDFIHDRMPIVLDDSLTKEYLENNILYDDLLNKSEDLKIELNFYPVGDLVNKMSNSTKDNILHKDEINYDKNKNLKLTNFFKRNNPIENSLDDFPVKKLIKDEEKNQIMVFKLLKENSKNEEKLKDKDKDDISTQISFTGRKEIRKRKISASHDKELSISKKKKKINNTSNLINKDMLKNFLNKK